MSKGSVPRSPNCLVGCESEKMTCCDRGWIFGQMAGLGLNPVMRLIDVTVDAMFECPGAVLPCTVDWVVWKQ